MSQHECPLVDDAPAYVLRALSDGEWELYEAHLASCRACAAKVAELEFVGDALLGAVPQVSAPPEIRDRVMSVVRAEAELLNAAGPLADRAPRRAARRGLRLPSLGPWPATVLASSLLALGIGGGALLVGAGDDPAPRTIACAQAPEGAACQMRLAGDSARLVVSGLQAPPKGRIYQVWLDRDDGTAPEPTTALFSVRKGSASVDVPGELDGVRQVLVTDEPLGGSEVPTRQPVIAARLA